MWDFDPTVRKTDKDLEKLYMNVVYQHPKEFQTFVEEDFDLSSNAIMEAITVSKEMTRIILTRSTNFCMRI